MTRKSKSPMISRDLRLAADGAEAAAVDRYDIRRERRARGGRDEIDRAAQCRGAEGERIAALIDLDRTEIFGVDLIEIAAAVGIVHRYAVLQQLEAAQMIIAREVRAAHGEAQLLPIARVDEDAGNILQRVAQIGDMARLHLRRGGVDEGDRADGLLDAALLLGDGGNGERAALPRGGRGGRVGADVDWRQRRLREGGRGGEKERAGGDAAREKRAIHGISPGTASRRSKRKKGAARPRGRFGQERRGGARDDQDVVQPIGARRG